MQQEHNLNNANNVCYGSQMNNLMCHVLDETRCQRILDELRCELDTDLLGVDAKWLLFGMAMQSYRYESLLLPRPPAYSTPAGYNINALHMTMGTMPDFKTIHKELLHNVLSPEQLELLHWLLRQSGMPQLHQLPRNEQLLLWRQLGQKPQPRPELVFRVDANLAHLESDECVFYSGDMEELYSLLASPLRDMRHTELEFFDDLEQACENADWSPGWGYSLCGTLLRCVAICQLREVATDPAQLLQVRYLLLYSMSYIQKMQRMRRGQWKAIEQKQRRNRQQLRKQDKQHKHSPPLPEPTKARSSFFSRVATKLSLLAFLGVLTFVSYSLRFRA